MSELATDILPLEEVIPPPTQAPFDAVAAGEKINQETTVLEFHIRKPGFTKPIPPDEFIRKIKEAGEQALTPEQEQILEQYRAQIVQTKGPDGEVTDTTMLHISQDILDRSEIAKIVNHDDKFGAWLKAQSIPSPMLAAGMYQIRLYRVSEIDKAIEAYITRRAELIESFRLSYMILKEQAKKRRWPFFEESDYPSWEIIAAKYRVEARYITFNVPAALEKLNSEIYQREMEKAKLQWADAAQEARDVQRMFAQGLLDTFATMLGKDDKGKRRMFRPSAVKKLSEFLNMFNDLNITNDTELEGLVGQIRQVMDGVDVESLKKDMSMRDAFESTFTELKKQADSLVVVKTRKVVFDDAPDEDVQEDDALPLN